MAQFCRHNRFVAECPICSKGTVLDSSRAPARRSTSRPRAVRRRPDPTPQFKGKYARAGPYMDEGGSYEIRLERVPGGLRLASWSAGSIRRAAPVLPVDDLPGLLQRAAESGVVDDGSALLLPDPLGSGASPGRAGELREELRVERLNNGRVRVARWLLRPGRGWELQEAPVMLPAARYAEALEAASG